MLKRWEIDESQMEMKVTDAVTGEPCSLGKDGKDHVLLKLSKDGRLGARFGFSGHVSQVSVYFRCGNIHHHFVRDRNVPGQSSDLAGSANGGIYLATFWRSLRSGRRH